MKKNNILNILQNDYKTYLNFFKSRYPIFHNSVVFFRDFQYAIFHFFELKGIKLRYSDCEQLAYKFGEFLVQKNIFKNLEENNWILNYPDFKTGEIHKFKVTE